MCGAPNDDEDIFCGNCGAALNPEAAPGEAGVPAEEPAEEGREEVERAPRVPEETIVETEREWVPEAPPPPPPPTPSVRAAQTVPTSGMAIASLVLGIAGLTVLPLLASVLAVILGYVARREIREHEGEVSGDGVALAGIVTGWIGIGLAVLGVVLVGGVLGCGLCGAFGTGNW
jgi:hypothetical protein